MTIATKSGLGPILGFTTQELKILAALARRDMFRVCLDASNGHVGGCSSSVEQLIALYFGGILRLNLTDPHDPERDRVLVRGHLGPLRYRLFAWLGWLEESELPTYRVFGSRLHGHEDHLHTPGVDITPSGSLGMQLSFGAGAAVAARDKGLPFRTFVSIGDGETQEGNIHEAACHAAALNLGNLVVILDRNKKQLSNPTMVTEACNAETVWRGYGWRTITVDGHNINQLLNALREATASDSAYSTPTIIIADTVKGFGLEGAEDHFSGYHTFGRAGPEIVERGIASINTSLDPVVTERVMQKLTAIRREPCTPATVAEWYPVKLTIAPNPNESNHLGDGQSEHAPGDYYRQLHQVITTGALPPEALYFLTADVTTAKTVETLQLGEMFHFHNVGVREQHMVALAHGISVTRPEARILLNGFDVFYYRCMDQIHAAMQGGGNMILLGNIAGITHARNGRTHQSIGQPAALLAMDDMTFLEPWDTTDLFACLNWALGESRGVVYIRIHSANITETPDDMAARTLTYYMVRDAESPNIVLVASGMTVTSCIAAANQLASTGIRTRVVNVVNPRTLDDGFRSLIDPGKPVLTVYNGHPAILRQHVAGALLDSVAPIASRCHGIGFTQGTTGALKDLLPWSKLDCDGVVRAAQELLA